MRRAIRIPSVPETALPAPDDAALEEERERFLREFKSQVLRLRRYKLIRPRLTRRKVWVAAWKEIIRADSNRPTVCQELLYARLQERVDLLEAALHMDLIEATRVVYEAVWADPSDPSKTYQNAARAVLREMRKRAGISPCWGRSNLWPTSQLRSENRKLKTGSSLSTASKP